MKNLYTIVLTCCLLLQMSSKTVTTLLFHFNKSYIIQNICHDAFVPVNSDKSCQGNCFLLKSLAGTEEEHSRTPVEINQSADVFYIYEPECLTLHLTFIVLSCWIDPPDHENDEYFSELLRPPAKYFI